MRQPPWQSPGQPLERLQAPQWERQCPQPFQRRQPTKHRTEKVTHPPPAPGPGACRGTKTPLAAPLTAHVTLLGLEKVGAVPMGGVRRPRPPGQSPPGRLLGLARVQVLAEGGGGGRPQRSGAGRRPCARPNLPPFKASAGRWSYWGQGRRKQRKRGRRMMRRACQRTDQRTGCKEMQRTMRAPWPPKRPSLLLVVRRCAAALTPLRFHLFNSKQLFRKLRFWIMNR